MIPGCSSEYHATVRRLCILGTPLSPTLLAGLLSLALMVAPRPALAASTGVHPWLDGPPGWTASVEVVNLGATATAVRLLAYDSAGSFLGEVPGGMTLAPGGQGSYATAPGVLPLGTALLTVQADTPLASGVLLGAPEGSAQEVLLPGSLPARELMLPVLSGSPPWESRLRLGNAGTLPTTPTVGARDAAGHLLGSVPLPALDPWASTTVALSTLFAPRSWRARPPSRSRRTSPWSPSNAWAPPTGRMWRPSPRPWGRPPSSSCRSSRRARRAPCGAWPGY